MGKYQKKKTRRSCTGILLTAVVILVLAILVLLALPRTSRPPVTEPESSETETGVSATELRMTESTGDAVLREETEPDTELDIELDKSVEFPLELDNGSLEIESLFQYEGINPDCGNREADNVAAIMIRNTSDLYLKSAAIHAVLGDGTEISFRVSELPAGKETLAFSVDNLELADDYVCTAVQADSVFEDEKAVDGVSVSVDGMMVTVTNEIGNDLYEIDVYCRSVFGDSYFGGVTYVYTIEKLPAGESTTIAAADCILGVADVVRLAVENERREG